MVAAAEVEPFELAEIGFEVIERDVPGALERLEILLAQGVHVQAVDQLDMLFGQLVDREAQPRMRRAGVIARHFAFGVERVEPQADIEVSPRARAASMIAPQRTIWPGELKITWSDSRRISARSSGL